MPDFYSTQTDDQLRDLMRDGDEEATMELDARQHDYTVSHPGDVSWLDGVALDWERTKRAFPHPDDEATLQARIDDRADGLIA